MWILTARHPDDYTFTDNAPALPIAGTLTFNPGEVFKNIQVNIVKDDTPELSEKFAVQLSDPHGANLVQYEDAAFVTINDDDLTPILIRVFYDGNGNGYKDQNENTIKDVSVDFTYSDGTTSHTVAGVYTYILGQNDYFYQADVLLGQVSVTVDGDTVKSPYQNSIILFFGTGDYETTTNNETQSTDFKGIVGLSPYTDVGYRTTFAFSLPSGTKDSGRGGTDDVVFGGPGDDVIDAGAGDDHVVGGHWMTATDEHAPINEGTYNAVVEVVTSGLHPVYGDGPIFQVNTTSPDAGINAGGSISGQIWIDNNNNRQQDAGELFTEQVLVNLYDCDGNPINSVVTNDGTYTFTGLYINEGEDSEYVVEFALPHDYEFVSFVPKPDTINQDVMVGGRTDIVVLNSGSMSATDIDAGVKGSNVARLPVTGGFQFGEPSYSVAESVKDGFLTISVVRTTSTDPRAVVVKTFDGTAQEGVNYTSVTALLFFDIGETIKTLDIPIVNSDSIGICTTPLTIKLELRDVTGRPFDRATVYVGGETFGDNTDDDVIQGGGRLGFASGRFRKHSRRNRD